MSMGAQTNDILRMILRSGMTLTVLGLAIGLPVAFVLRVRWLRCSLAWKPLIHFRSSACHSFLPLLQRYMPISRHAGRATRSLKALRYE